MNIKEFYTAFAGILILISFCFLSSFCLDRRVNEFPTTSLDFRVHECLKTNWPGRCIRDRGLIIPGQSRIHRFVIYGGELNVWARQEPQVGRPHEDPELLDEDFMQILTSSNSRLNQKDGLGLTALDYAAKGSNMYTILRRAGARHSDEL